MYRYATQPELPSPIRHGEPCLRVAFAVGPSSPRTPAPDNLFLPTPSESECWKRRNHHANARRMEKEDATCIRIVHVRTSKRAHPNDPRTGICSPILRSAYEQKSQTELEIRCRRSLIWRSSPETTGDGNLQTERRNTILSIARLLSPSPERPYSSEWRTFKPINVILSDISRTMA